MEKRQTDRDSEIERQTHTEREREVEKKNISLKIYLLCARKLNFTGQIIVFGSVLLAGSDSSFSRSRQALLSSLQRHV